MNKKITSAFIAVLLIVPITSAKADIAKPTLAIIDTALDSSLPEFKGRITQEVCIIQWSSCANGKDYQEGPGAASMPANLIKLNGFDHGTYMTSIALAQNPNINVVFIRIIGATSTGVRQITSESSVYKALDWVIANKDKYNIQAISMSQGRHDFPSVVTSNYCPSTPTTKSRIQTLISMGIPSFFPTGNSRDYQRIDWPSCIEDSIAIGAVDQQNEIAIYGNYDPLRTDFFALGSLQATGPGNVVSNVAGTSAASQVAAAQWITIKQSHATYNYQQIYDLISATAKNTFNAKINSAKLINLQGAINGK